MANRRRSAAPTTASVTNLGTSKMTISKLRWCVAFTFGCYLAEATAAERTTNVEIMIDGIVARARALYTIKIEYSYNGEIVQDDQILQSESRQLNFLMEGNDWLLQANDSPNFRMNRHQESFRYYEATTDRHPRIDRSLRIAGSESLEDLVHEHASHAVVRLGTFWFEPQANFVDQHRRECVYRGTTMIDETRVHLLEWKIKSNQFDEAMIVIPRSIAAARSGVLRVYASEDFNWALPRVEYCTSAGQTKRRFSASQFKQIANGIYFPELASSDRHMGNRVQKSRFHVASIQYVNQRIPASEFSLRAGIGTRVRDARPGMATTVFHLQRPEDVDHLEQDLAAAPDTTQKMPRHRRLLLLGNLIVLFVLLTAWGIRRCRV